jgi:Cu2+-exporting ATPase/Cu+-exporting ATPase
MLTGDRDLTAAAIAKEAGVSSFRASLLPDEKEKIIRELQGQGKRVMMVGDGINDAPALARADVGVAIGAGTDIAMDTADIVLMHSDLMDVVTTIELSHATLRNIKQNLFWAFIYNIIGIPLAAGVLYPAFGLRLNPMFAAAAMSFSSLFVVGNSQRLRNFEPKHQAGLAEAALPGGVGAEPEKAAVRVETLALEAGCAPGAACEPRADEELAKNTAAESDRPEDKGDNSMDMKKIIMKIEGMSCNHCKNAVEKGLKLLEGVEDVVVDLDAKIATVLAEASVDEAALVEAVEELGYEFVGME